MNTDIRHPAEASLSTGNTVPGWFYCQVGLPETKDVLANKTANVSCTARQANNSRYLSVSKLESTAGLKSNWPQFISVSVQPGSTTPEPATVSAS